MEKIADVAWVTFFWAMFMSSLCLANYIWKPFGDIAALQYLLIGFTVFAFVKAIYDLYMR